MRQGLYISGSSSGAFPVSQKSDPFEVVHKGTGVCHVMPNFFDHLEHDSIPIRLSVYADYWDAYTGLHAAKSEEDEAFYNLCRVTVNKSNDWLFGKGWSVIAASPGNEEIAKAVEGVLEDNDKELVSLLCGHSGAITGDAYLHVTLDTEGGAVDFEDAKIRINWLQAQYVHPFFDPVTRRHLLGVLIQYPVGAIRDGNKVVIHNTALTESYTSTKAVFSLYITKDMVHEYVDNTLLRAYENDLGEIGVFHAQNLVTSRGWMGESELEDLWPVNRQLDRVFNSMQQVVNYNADPTTVIIGARAEALERGPNSVWCIPNADAKVINLETGGKMGGAGDHFIRMMEVAGDLTGVTPATLGKIQSLTNVKAAAIEMLTLPLMEKTRRKRITYGRMLSQVCSMVARILVAQNPGLLRKARDTASFDKFRIKFESPLPRDEEEYVNTILAKLSKGLTSQMAAIRDLGVRDPQGLALEILADKRETILTDAERAKALNGGVVNPTVTHVGSVAMGVDDRRALEQEAKVFEALIMGGSPEDPDGEPSNDE